MSEKDKVLIDLWPVWDAINDLNTLEGALAAIVLLTDPERLTKDDDNCARMHGLFVDIWTRLSSASHALETARNNPFIVRKGMAVAEVNPPAQTK